MCSVSEKVNSRIQTAGLEPKSLDLKLGSSFLQNISLESDANLQEKWAELLANALTSKKDVTKKYISILGDLEPLEVKILDTIYSNLEKTKEISKQNISIE